MTDITTAYWHTVNEIGKLPFLFPGQIEKIIAQETELLGIIANRLDLTEPEKLTTYNSFYALNDGPQ